MKNIINSKGVETKIFANTFEYDAFEQRHYGKYNC